MRYLNKQTKYKFKPIINKNPKAQEKSEFVENFIKQPKPNQAECVDVLNSS